MRRKKASKNKRSVIIFGLGNPGPTYRLTRHNVGYLVADRFTRHHHRRFRRKQGFQTASVPLARTTIYLIKPQCWMNQSGVAVRRYLEAAGATEVDFMVVVDDANLPLGRMRLRARGSDGGHNGLRSVIEELSTDDFPRLRIGIGRDEEVLADYVLSRFSRREKQVLYQILDKSVAGLMTLFTGGFQKAQNFINAIDLSET